MFPEILEIKEIRTRLGITQKKLSQIADVSQSAIAKIESNTMEPSYSLIKKIFEALESFKHKKNKKAKNMATLNIIFAKPNERIQTILEKMKQKKIGQLPVIEKGLVIGSISERKIAQLISTYKNAKKLSALKVREVMEDAFPIVNENTNYQVLRELLNYNRAVLTAKKGKIKGIITRWDLIRR